MKHLQILHIFFSYIARHRFLIILLLCFAGIFIGVFSLYSLPSEAVIYSCILCFVLGILLMTVRFFPWYRKHLRLQTAQKSLLLMTRDLPEPASLLEKDYQSLVLSLNRMYSDKITEEQAVRSELTDYYTTWVHQIKTPIAAMQLLLRNEDTSSGRQLKAELFRIEQYVEMVLCYFRLGSSTNDFVLQYCDLDHIIRRSIRKFAGQFIQKRISLIYEPVKCSVLTDEKWLSFVIEQLLSNAVKYTNEGSVTISVSSNQVLSISDTGIGISDEDLPRIFEKSYTGYNGRIDRRSTGLGLYLCQRILRRLSHPISVISEPGKGSTFSIDLSRPSLDTE